MDLKRRVEDLATAVGIDLESERVDADRCWVVASVRCPYGDPYGQYVLRPTGFCHPLLAMGDGCATYHRHVEDQELTEEQERTAICKHFDAEKTDLVGDLNVIADDLPDGSAEQMAVRLAADVIDAENRNKVILVEDDLPK